MEFLELIKKRLDPDELVDILGISTERLTDLLVDDILLLKDRFYFLLEDEDIESEDYEDWV